MGTTWVHRSGRRGHSTVTSPGRFAALVDIENVVIVGGRRLPTEQMEVLLNFVQPYLYGMPVRMAAGGKVLVPYMDVIGSRGWGLTLVNVEPDSADRALLETAQGFLACGVTDLVVVSGDHAFAPLAAQARLHVITHADRLSRSLQLAATTITYLPTVRDIARAS